MWTAIAADNADAITTALLAYEETLRTFREAIANRDAVATRSLLDAGRDWFEASFPE